MTSKKEIFSVQKAEDSAGFLIWQVTSLWQRSLNKILKKYKLTHAQFVVLASSAWLGRNSSHVTQAQIATYAKMDKMLVSNVVRMLEKKKLITRFESKKDTRAKLVVLTPVGFKILAPALNEVENFDRQFFGKLDKALKNFNSGLVKLIQENKI